MMNPYVKWLAGSEKGLNLMENTPDWRFWLAA
jgi:hypothetical protein